MGIFSPLSTVVVDQKSSSDGGNGYSQALARIEKTGLPFNFHGIVGRSESMLNVLKTICKIADYDCSCLIEGESGTGKEIVARAIHEISSRKDKSFMIINCTTIVESLMESELFGHERGAFTGAVERKLGKFEAAHRGTVFLDEISELPLRLQAKLLRAIQEKEFTRVGSTKLLKADVRIITATNRNPRSLVRQGKFREDLFYRIKVVKILLPPLRERPEDIPVLTDHFLRLYSRRYGRKVEGMKDESLDLLLRYTWPGNVRELEHVIERAVVMCDGSKLRLEDISFENETEGDKGTWNYDEAVREFQRQFLIRALASNNRSKRDIARMMEMSHAKLYRLMKKLGING